VEVGFPNSSLARTFNEFRRLQRIFSPEMACKIANRLAVLTAADNLALVPTSPPVGLRSLAGRRMRFGVTLSETHYLVFIPLLAQVAPRRIDLSRVTTIEIQGVEKL